MNTEFINKKRANIIAKEIQLENSKTLGPVMFHGESMLPFLEDGDELIVMTVRWEEIKIGDIITYRFQDKFPTYRIVKKLEDKVVLKPDNWMLLCEVPREDVLGKVIERRRGGSSLLYTDWLWILTSQRILFKKRSGEFISKIKYHFRRIKEFVKESGYS
jgi:hypothetical protein